MNALEEINKQIKDVENQSADLKSQLENRKSRLIEARDEQKSMILNGESTNKIEAEIINLRTKIQGTQSALESLDVKLKDLQKDKKFELNKTYLIQAEQARTDSQKTLEEAYLLLVAFVKKISELETKAREYRAVLRKADSKTADSKSSKLTFLVESLKKGVYQLLQGYPFPDEMFKDGTLPLPDQLKRSLRHNSEITSDRNGSLQPPQNYHR